MTIGDNYNLVAGNERLISYLPLSHIAAQMEDIYMSIYGAMTVYFAQPDALKGTLLQTMLDVRPTVFFGVPRFVRSESMLTQNYVIFVSWL